MHIVLQIDLIQFNFSTQFFSREDGPGYGQSATIKFNHLFIYLILFEYNYNYVTQHIL